MVHEQTGALTVLLAGATDTFAEQTVVEQIERALAAQGVRPLPITVTRVAAIPRTAAGKAPLFRSTHPVERPAGKPREPRMGEREQ
ncbi:hypothetical protein GCM10010210_38670 [Pseudonocardia hydrocarbonoxydans]